MSWRSIAATVIQKVIAENPGKDENELRRLVSQAYPFGERSMHPYKIWCSEVNHWLKGTARTQIAEQKRKEEMPLFTDAND